MNARDLAGETCIRLARAYQHAWAKNIPANVPWNWKTAEYFINIAKQKTKPRVGDGLIVFDSRKSSTHWKMGEGRAQVTMLDKGAITGGVSTGRDEAGKPWMLVRIHDWSSLGQEQVWRYDRALTSLACGDWRVFYQLPPLSVLGPVLGSRVPSVDVRLWFVMAGEKPTISLESSLVASPEVYAAVESAEELLRKFEKAGGFEKWHLAKVKP